MVTLICLMETTLPEWLQAQMDERNITAAELARRSGISAPQITRLLSGQRGVSELSLRAISEALGIPPEVAFRVAGFLPPVAAKTEQTDRLLYLFNQLSDKDKQTILQMAEFLLNKE